MCRRDKTMPIRSSEMRQKKRKKKNANKRRTTQTKTTKLSGKVETREMCDRSAEHQNNNNNKLMVENAKNLIFRSFVSHLPLFWMLLRDRATGRPADPVCRQTHGMCVLAASAGSHARATTAKRSRIHLAITMCHVVRISFYHLRPFVCFHWRRLRRCRCRHLICHCSLCGGWRCCYC